MRYSLLVFLLMLGLFVWRYSRDEPQPLENKVPEVLKHEQTTANTESSTTATILPDKVPIEDANFPEYTATQQVVLAEITPYEFSPDPYVEVRSLEWSLAVCMFDDVIKKMNSNHSQLHPAQIKQQSETAQSCQQQRLRYPKLTSMSTENNFKDIFQPQSELGRLMASDSQEMSRQQRLDNEKRILRAAIKKQISPLLHANGLMHLWGSMDMEELSLTLGSQDKSHIMQTSHHALSLLACEFDGGESCKNTSTLMTITCSQYPEACGLDFPSWYQQTTLPGMRKDVDVLINHYRQLN